MKDKGSRLSMERTPSPKPGRRHLINTCKDLGRPTKPMYAEATPRGQTARMRSGDRQTVPTHLQIYLPPRQHPVIYPTALRRLGCYHLRSVQSPVVGGHRSRAQMPKSLSVWHVKICANGGRVSYYPRFGHPERASHRRYADRSSAASNRKSPGVGHGIQRSHAVPAQT